MVLTESVVARRWAAAYFAAAMLWLGLLIGVAFLATPVKFMAPSLSLPVALDVGRYTFYVFNKVEWVLAVVLVVAPSGGGMVWPRLLAVAAGIVMVVETVWMLPLLDHRVGIIIAGRTPPASDLHVLYIVMEVAKALLLGSIAFDRARRLVRAPLRSVTEA